MGIEKNFLFNTCLLIFFFFEAPRSRSHHNPDERNFDGPAASFIALIFLFVFSSYIQGISECYINKNAREYMKRKENQNVSTWPELSHRCAISSTSSLRRGGKSGCS
jgi:hypothetical protein